MLPVQKKSSINPSTNSLILGDEDLKNETMQQPINTDDFKDIINDLSKYSTDGADFISEMKLNAKCAKFEKAFEKILLTIKNINPDDKQQLETIFKIVIQGVEDYIFHPDKNKRNKLKHDVAIKLLKPFIGNDEKLCEHVINMTLKTITKTSLYRRYKKKAIRAFFFVLKMFSKAI